MDQSGSPSDPAAPTPPSDPGAPTPPVTGWAAPPPPVEAGPAGFVYADVPNRAIAYIIDSILVGILAAIVGAILAAIGLSTGSFEEGTLKFNVNVVGVIVSAIVGAAISAGYFIYTWTRMRGTLGMRVLNMQIGNAGDGKTMTTDQGVRRWLVIALPGILAQVLFVLPLLGVRPGPVRLGMVHLPAVDDRDQSDQAGLPGQVRQHDGREGGPRRRLTRAPTPVSTPPARPGAFVCPPDQVRTAARAPPASRATGRGSVPSRAARRSDGRWREPRDGRAARRASRPGRASRADTDPLEPIELVRSTSGSPRQPHRTVRSLGTAEKQTPWSTPWTCRPPSTGRMWPPLRSVLFMTASRTAIRRSRGSSSTTMATTSTSGSASTNAWTMPSPNGPSRRIVGGTIPQPVASDTCQAATSRRASVPSGKSSSGRSPRVGL